MRSTSTLLISPWGDPRGWKEVEYKIEGLKMKSRSSYIPLAYHLSNFGNLKGMIFVMASLADREILAKNANTESNGERLYIHLSNDISKYLEKMIRETKSNERLENLNKIVDNTEVFVTQALGKFKGVRFKGDLESSFVATYFAIHNELKNKKYDKVVIDTTHGLNYQTIITLIASQVASAVFDKKLEVRNSEPFVMPRKKETNIKSTIPNTLSLNILEISNMLETLKLNTAVKLLRMIDERELLEYAKGLKKVTTMFGVSEEKAREYCEKYLNSALNKIREIGKVVCMLRLGMPLLAYWSKDKLRGKVDYEYLRMPDIKYRLLNYNFDKEKSELNFLEKPKSEVIVIGLAEVLPNEIYQRFLAFDDLEEFIEKIKVKYKENHLEQNKTLLENELNDLYRSENSIILRYLCNNFLLKGRKFPEILELKGKELEKIWKDVKGFKEDVKLSEDRLRRNMLAHAGLSFEAINSIKLKIKENKYNITSIKLLKINYKEKVLVNGKEKSLEDVLKKFFDC